MSKKQVRATLSILFAIWFGTGVQGQQNAGVRESRVPVGGTELYARLVTLKGCGHFTFMECPVPVHREIDSFFARE